MDNLFKWLATVVDKAFLGIFIKPDMPKPNDDDRTLNQIDQGIRQLEESIKNLK